MYLHFSIWPVSLQLVYANVRILNVYIYIAEILIQISHSQMDYIDTFLLIITTYRLIRSAKYVVNVKRRSQIWYCVLKMKLLLSLYWYQYTNHLIHTFKQLPSLHSTCTVLHAHVPYLCITHANLLCTYIHHSK